MFGFVAELVLMLGLSCIHQFQRNCKDFTRKATSWFVIDILFFYIYN